MLIIKPYTTISLIDFPKCSPSIKRHNRILVLNSSRYHIRKARQVRLHPRTKSQQITRSPAPQLEQVKFLNRWLLLCVGEGGDFRR